MNQQNLSKAAFCLLSFLFASGAGAATLGQQTITESLTPRALACGTQRYVNKLTVRVIPGFEGKVFVGIKGMNPATYANTLAILYPNLGAHSWGDVKASGAIDGSFGSYAVPFVSKSTPISILRAQAIPGGDGKLWIGTNKMTAAQPDAGYANVLKVLWPSQGNYDVGEGWSERFTQACHAGPVSAPNCLDLQDFTFWPYIPSEQLLVFALGR